MTQKFKDITESSVECAYEECPDKPIVAPDDVASPGLASDRMQWLAAVIRYKMGFIFTISASPIQN